LTAFSSAAYSISLRYTRSRVCLSGRCSRGEQFHSLELVRMRQRNPDSYSLSRSYVADRELILEDEVTRSLRPSEKYTGWRIRAAKAFVTKWGVPLDRLLTLETTHRS
jgi:hypothetical protein